MFTASSVNPHDNEGPLMIRVAAAMMGLSGVAVCLRFTARKIVRQPCLWDDWMIILALLFAWATCIFEIRGIRLHEAAEVY